jgi:hypothetical protein
MRRFISIVGALSAVAAACTLFTDLSGFNGTPAGPAEGGADGDAADSDADITSCDADITSDPTHCGACNRNCLGGSCEFGKCSATMIVSGLPQQTGIAIANGKLWVSVTNAIRQYELDGGGGLDIVSSPHPAYLSADATYLYWVDTTESKLKRWPMDGGAIEELAQIDPTLRPLGTAVSGTHVYFTHYVYDGGVERVLLDGGGREVVFQPYNRPEDIDFADGELVVGGDGVNELAVFADAGSGSKRTLSTGGGPCSMTVKDGFIYFGEQYNRDLVRIPFAGGAKEVLVMDAGRPVGVAASDDAIYWRETGDAGDHIWRLAR